MWCSLDVHTYIVISEKSSNRYTQTQFTNVLSCEMQSKFRDFKKRPLRCSNIAQLAFQSLHTFFASLRSYLNLGAACTTVRKQHTLHTLLATQHVTCAFRKTLVQERAAIKAAFSLGFFCLTFLRCLCCFLGDRCFQCLSLFMFILW